MPTTTPLTDAINALTTYANETTGASDTDLSSAVATLVAGYGGGSGSPVLLYKWDFTKSLTDEVGGKTATLYGATRDVNGLHLAGVSQYVYLGTLALSNNTIEIDFSSTNKQSGGTNVHGRLVTYNNNAGLIWRYTGKWSIYTTSWQDSTFTDPNYFSGHTLKIYLDDYQKPWIYRDNDFMFKGNAMWSNVTEIGSNSNAYFNADITEVRIYKGDTTK